MPEQKNSDMKDLHENLWPTGWYLYENGQFVGPLSADEAFSDRGATVDGKPRLVSRKGFAQWYPVQDLASIYSATLHAKEESARRIAEAERQLSEQAKLLAESQARRSEPPKKSLGKVWQKSVDPASVKARTSGSASQVVPPHSETPKRLKQKRIELQPEMGRVSSEAPTKPTQPISETRHAVVPDHGTGPAKTPVTQSAGAKTPQVPPGVEAPQHATKTDTQEAKGPTGTKVAPKPISKGPESVSDQPDAKTQKAQPVTNAKTRMMHDYLVLRGRMRLGKIRNPWVAGFFNCIASAGIYFYFWFSDTYKELTWHCQNRDQFKMPPAIFCMIPLVHFYMLFRLAQLAAEMERQNKYQTVSPWLTVMYGIFPPFAVTYLQDAINRHWMLHVRHAVARKVA